MGVQQLQRYRVAIRLPSDSIRKDSGWDREPPSRPWQRLLAVPLPGVRGRIPRSRVPRSLNPNSAQNPSTEVSRPRPLSRTREGGGREEEIISRTGNQTSAGSRCHVSNSTSTAAVSAHSMPPPSTTNLTSTPVDDVGCGLDDVTERRRSSATAPCRGAREGTPTILIFSVHEQRRNHSTNKKLDQVPPLMDFFRTNSSSLSTFGVSASHARVQVAVVDF